MKSILRKLEKILEIAFQIFLLSILLFATSLFLTQTYHIITP